MRSVKVVSWDIGGGGDEYGVSLDGSDDPAEQFLYACESEKRAKELRDKLNALVSAMARRFACSAPAEWELCGTDPYDITYSCNEHLGDMVAVDTYVINAVDKESDEACCFIATTNDDVVPAASVSVMVWRDGSLDTHANL